MTALLSWFRNNLGLVVVLAALIILRIPNFYEPYWYGDEAIYLTIGNAMNNGQQLYSEIVDHKTPIIYFLARVPDQISFRWLNLGWMLVTTVLFYALAEKLFKKPWLSTLATTVFMVLTTTPWLEGNIPNGELFVAGFVMLGMWVLTHTQVWQQFFAKNPSLKTLNAPRELLLLAVAGACFGLGILTKVPALLDLGAALLLFWFMAVRLVWQQKLNFKKLLTQLIPAGMSFMAGAVVPMLVSVVYFVALGTGQAYLNFGLLYNLHYTQTWKQDYGSAFLNWAFTLPGKTALLAATVVVLSVLSKKIKPTALFALGWFAAALFALLLSNRPYPHYFVQLVPPAALLVGVAIESLLNLLSMKQIVSAGLGLALPLAAFWLTGAVMLKLNAGLYDTEVYYAKFWALMTGKISRESYNHSFDSLVAENELVAADLATIKPNRIFIWGTNPTLYAQTKIVPAGRFTVAFHIQDLKVYDQTMIEIQAAKPEVIIVMSNEEKSFPALNEYVDQNYQLWKQYPRMTLYRRAPQPLQ